MTSSAVFFALRAHGAVPNEDGSLGQKRKYSGEPYEHHLLEVANLVQAHGGDCAQIDSAWLHDVVEDTPVTIEEIGNAFGHDVAGLVLELTDVFTKAAYPALNMARRKRLEAQRLGRISHRAQSIKYADFISNGRSILALDRNFGEVYLGEVRDALLQMQRGDQALRAIVEKIVEHEEGITKP